MKPDNPAPPFETILQKRLSRRDFLSGAGKALLGSALLSSASASAFARTLKKDAEFSFKEIAKNDLETLSLAEGYEAQILLRWGDALFPDSSPFNFERQTQAAQEKQFGTSCDYIAFFPLKSQERGLLWVNHEYADSIRMFPGLDDASKKTVKQIRIEMAAVGGSICEIELKDNLWKPVITSSYNRRITANTPMRIAGPAAGHGRMKTSYDKTGKRVLGMLSNCAGGVTPWGTVLTCEENFNDFFANASTLMHAESKNHKRYSVGEGFDNKWERAEDRFDVPREPNEPNRFGWVVEIDPYDPHSLPVKRTALGRFKHETATVTFASAHDKRLVIYSGDDEKFEYLYRFVSKGAFDQSHASANRHLLDEGVLSVARFDEAGKCSWLPLVFGQGPLNQENGFYSQADVLIETRRAADLLGATPMDRPEGIAVDRNGNAYIAMTKNSDRTEKAVNLANPRANNRHGHIIKLSPADGSGNMARDVCEWEIFLMGGDPSDSKDHALYQKPPSKEGWLSCPDNLAIDPGTPGHLWIATDGQTASIEKNDGLYVCDLEGKYAGMPRLFLTAPRGAEITGPCFTRDGSNLFMSIQHPAEGKDSTASKPDTRWPDFDDKLPPRSSVIVVRKKSGTSII